MKAITIKQPWASLIIEGIKDIENRTWATNFRGKILIHTSAKPIKVDPYSYLPLNDHQWPAIKKQNKELLRSVSRNELPNGYIIGYVEVIDCAVNHSSIWAENINDCPFGVCDNCTDEIYNWVLANPVKFDTPIPAKGQLSLWNFNICESCFKPVDDLRECERCESMIGDCCQAEYNQFTQIDYNCCKSCGIDND